MKTLLYPPPHKCGYHSYEATNLTQKNPTESDIFLPVWQIIAKHYSLIERCVTKR